MKTMSGLYIHTSGNVYLVYGTVKDSTNAREVDRETEQLVRYQSIDSLDGNSDHGMNVRLESEFHEIVEWPDKVKRARFCLLTGITSISWWDPETGGRYVEAMPKFLTTIAGTEIKSSKTAK
jgi:hypothetical protein